MSIIETKKEFETLVGATQNGKGYKKPLMFGICRVDSGQLNTEKVLQATFPVVNVNENFGSAAIFINALQSNGVKVDFTKTEQIFTLSEGFVNTCKESFNPYLDKAVGDKHKNVQVIKNFHSKLNYSDPNVKDHTTKKILNGIKRADFDKGIFKIVFIFENREPESVESVYLKLYALSLGKSKLRTLNLNGAFGILPNVAWSGRKPYELEYLRENEIELKIDGQYPNIDSVDKFPRFLQHIIPQDNTRILDASKVRFGAQLAAGTTVMPGASYINFNAGTLGPVMVEGRISSSAIVGANSDIGGGASILGVLSGTDGNPITIGENCLLDVNSVTGISIANGCRVSCKIDPGSKFTIPESEVEKLKEVNPQIDIKAGLVKAKDIQGLNGAWFRMNSESGHLEIVRSTKEVKLNAELH